MMFRFACALALVFVALFAFAPVASAQCPVVVGGNSTAFVTQSAVVATSFNPFVATFNVQPLIAVNRVAVVRQPAVIVNTNRAAVVRVRTANFGRVQNVRVRVR